MVERTCGSCSLCCKLMEVEVLEKPPGRWCTFCAPGHGCKIHPLRPDACRNYFCQWLLGEFDGEIWYPLRSKIIVDLTDVDPDGRFLRFTVDPGYPNRWKQEPYYATIKNMALLGLRHDKYKTVVSLNGEWTLILPDKEISHAAGQVLKYPGDRYVFVPFQGPVKGPLG